MHRLIGEAFGFGFAGLAIWLAVRIANGRRPTARFMVSIVSGIAVLLGAWAAVAHYQYRRQMQAIAVVERLGGSVRVSCNAPEWLQRLQPDHVLFGFDGLGPDWLRKYLPAKYLVDYFLVVEEVDADRGPGLRAGPSNISGERRDVTSIKWNPALRTRWLACRGIGGRV